MKRKTWEGDNEDELIGEDGVEKADGRPSMAGDRCNQAAIIQIKK